MDSRQERATVATVRRAILTLLIHCLLPMAWFVFAIFVMPLVGESLSELSAAIPAAGTILLQGAQFAGRYCTIFAAALVAALAADVVIYLALLGTRRPWLASVWSLCMSPIRG